MCGLNISAVKNGAWRPYKIVQSGVIIFLPVFTFALFENYYISNKAWPNVYYRPKYKPPDHKCNWEKDRILKMEPYLAELDFRLIHDSQLRLIM